MGLWLTSHGITRGTVPGCSCLVHRNPQCTGPSSRPASHHPHLNANPMGHILCFCHSSTQLQLLVSALVSGLIMSLLPLVLSAVYWKAFSTPLCGEAIWSTQALRTLGQGRDGEEAHCPSSEWLRHFRSGSVGHTDHRLHFQVQEHLQNKWGTGSSLIRKFPLPPFRLNFKFHVCGTGIPKLS